MTAKTKVLGSYTSSQLALKCLDVIHTATSTWVATTSIRNYLGVTNDGEWTRLVAVLKKLESCKLLERQGTGKFFWRLLVTTWNQTNPFLTVPTNEHNKANSTPAPDATIDYSNTNIIRYANNLLDYCAARPGVYISSQELFSKGVHELTTWSIMIAILQRARFCGRLLRGGGTGPKARFVWQSATATWPRTNPLNADTIAGDVSVVAPQTPTVEPVEQVWDGTKVDHTSHLAAETPSSELLALKEVLAALAAKCEALEAKVELNGRSVKTIKVEKYDGTVTKLTDVVLPRTFDVVLSLAKCRRNILLVGPAGCGKTHLGMLIAKTLGLDFGSISCTSGMSEAHLLGRSTPNLTTGENKFQSTEFLDCYESGGVFLLDEIDAADPNLLLAINSALANGYCNVPNRPNKPIAKRHKDFVIVATANTFGRGANRMYSGRNQLDEATIDRFRIGTVECYYDEVIEAALCPSDALRTRLQTIRTKIEASGLRRIMSTRFIQDAYIMTQQGGWNDEQVLDSFFQGWSKEEMAKVRD